MTCAIQVTGTVHVYPIVDQFVVKNWRIVCALGIYELC
jgi:hypothetical protein